MRRLIEVARERGLLSMTGQVLAENPRMLKLAAELGFVERDSPEDSAVREVRLALA
jgi:acetyltransferase